MHVFMIVPFLFFMVTGGLGRECAARVIPSSGQAGGAGPPAASSVIMSNL